MRRIARISLKDLTQHLKRILINDISPSQDILSMDDYYKFLNRILFRARDPFIKHKYSEYLKETQEEDTRRNSLYDKLRSQAHHVINKNLEKFQNEIESGEKK